MRHVWFSLGFFAIHLGAYVVAGVLNQQLLSKHIYGGEQALFHRHQMRVSRWPA
jgi:hypothetical protein